MLIITMLMIVKLKFIIIFRLLKNVNNSCNVGIVTYCFVVCNNIFIFFLVFYTVLTYFLKYNQIVCFTAPGFDENRLETMNI